MLMKIFAIFAWCCASGAVYGMEPDTIEIRTIGIPPYGIQDESGPGGIYYDIANLIAIEAGLESNNYIYPYARIVNELKSGQTDLTIMIKYEELEAHVVYIAPLPPLQTVVVGLRGSDISSIEDLKGKTLAYLRGAQFSDVIDNDQEINKQDTRDFVQGAEMLVFGRVDGIVGPLDPILRALAEVENGAYVLDEPLVVSERTPWLQMSKKSLGQLDPEHLKVIFLDIVERGELERTVRQYTYPQ